MATSTTPDVQAGATAETGTTGGAVVRYFAGEWDADGKLVIAGAGTGRVLFASDADAADESVAYVTAGAHKGVSGGAVDFTVDALELTSDALGKLVPAADTDRVVAVADVNARTGMVFAEDDQIPVTVSRGAQSV